MKRHQFFLAGALAVLLVCGWTSRLHAAWYYSGMGHPYGYPGYPYGHPVYPYGLSYGHPVYPYGAYPGYPPPVPHYSYSQYPTYPGYPVPVYGTGGYTAYWGSSYGQQGWSAVAPKFREDAYSPSLLAKYGLPPHPAQFVPDVPPIKPVTSSPTPKKPSTNGKKKTAKVEVHMPAKDAELWVQGVKMKTGGLVRQFVTPPLDGDGPHPYTLAVSWTANGKVHTQTKHIEVQPGNTKVVLFGN